MDTDDLSTLQERLNYTFLHPDLLRQSLTHKSYLNEHRDLSLKDNERLEFLGDAVLDLVVCHALIEQFPDISEGELSKMKAQVVSEKSLAEVARSIGLGHFLLLGKGEQVTEGQKKPSLLSDAMEAVIAAIYLDRGAEAGLSLARQVILTIFEPLLKNLKPGNITFDFKTALQESIQKRFMTLPSYRLVSEAGPDHEKRFSIGVFVNDEQLGKGTGKNKKSAEQLAAKAALETLSEL